MTSSNEKRSYEEAQLYAADFLDSALSGESNRKTDLAITPKELTTTKGAKTSVKGRHGDIRMHRAVAARLMNPELTLFEALVQGGFEFSNECASSTTDNKLDPDRLIYDSDGVLLCQRKNQLSRRLRLAKKRHEASMTTDSYLPRTTNTFNEPVDSRSLQNMLLNGMLPVKNTFSSMPPHSFPNIHSSAAVPGNAAINMMYASTFLQPSTNLMGDVQAPAALTTLLGVEDDRKQTANGNLERMAEMTGRQIGIPSSSLNQQQGDMRFHPMMQHQFSGFYSFPSQFTIQGDLQNMNMQSLQFTNDLRNLLNRGILLDQMNSGDHSQINTTFGQDLTSLVPSNFDPPSCDSPLQPQTDLKQEDVFLPEDEDDVHKQIPELHD